MTNTSKGAIMRNGPKGAGRLLCLAGLVTGSLCFAQPATSQPTSAPSTATKTPIKHLVVIFDENVSFDHYFGTYPDALNPPGEPPFHALPGTAITLSGRTTGRPPPVP